MDILRFGTNGIDEEMPEFQFVGQKKSELERHGIYEHFGYKL